MSDPAFIAIMIGVLIPSVIFHEVAHAYTADLLGDDTARIAGRVSLNPIRHLDPVGTLAVPMVLGGLAAFAGIAPFIIAWARPVPVLQSQLRSPRVHSLWVSLAGPLTNFAIAGLAIGVFRWTRPTEDTFLWVALGLLTVVNVVLGILNLLPIPPLDGSAIIEFMLPRRALRWWYPVRRYSIVALFGLMVLGRGVFEPMFDWAVDVWRHQQ